MVAMAALPVGVVAAVAEAMPMGVETDSVAPAVWAEDRSRTCTGILLSPKPTWSTRSRHLRTCQACPGRHRQPLSVRRSHRGHIPWPYPAAAVTEVEPYPAAAVTEVETDRAPRVEADWG